MQNMIPIVLFFILSYGVTGTILYLPLYYTRGLPDSMGSRKKYIKLVATCCVSVAIITIAVLLIF
jgi:hypothetical protein